MAKIHHSAGQSISPFTSARRKNKSLWDQLELLLIPGVLAAGAFFVHDQLAPKQQDVADESATQEMLSLQPSLAQSSINPDLPNSDPTNGEQVLTQADSDTDLFWLDRPIRGQILKSLRREALIRSNRRISNFSEVSPSDKINLVGAQFGDAEPTRINIEASLLQNFSPTTHQELPRALFIDSSTRVNLSGVNLFENPLTRAALFETKLIKADFMGASFRKIGLTDMGFPDVSFWGSNPQAAALFSTDFNQPHFLSTDSNRARRLKSKSIKVAPLGSNFHKIGFIQAGFGTASLESVASSKENLPQTEPSDPNLNPQAPILEDLSATGFNELNQVQGSPSKAGSSEN